MNKAAAAKQKPDFTDKAFRVSLLLKALNGLAETIGGILLLLVSTEQINRWAVNFTEDELSQDPHDFIATHVLNTAHHLSGGSLKFGAIYLLSHGIVKLVLIVEVIRDKLWAYFALIVLLAVFIAYQLYRLLFVGFSWGMIYLTALDGLLIYLTVIEYKRHKALHESRSAKQHAANDS
jgi:uncharacterized membrane protein